MELAKYIVDKIEKKLTIGYIKTFLRNKGIATSECGETGLRFKLYNFNWDIFFSDFKLNMRIVFGLDNDIHYNCLLMANNALISDRFVVKAMIERDEGSGSTENQVTFSLAFTFETLCYTESAFDKVYEFAVYAVVDAIEYHQKLYHQFVQDYINDIQQDKPKIGFNVTEDSDDKTTVASNKQRRKIGFV